MSSLRKILVLNGGSSSIRFAQYSLCDSLEKLLEGKVDRIGLSGTDLHYHDLEKDLQGNCQLDTSDYPSTISFLLEWFKKREDCSSMAAIGHRIVHGMNHHEPEIVTAKLLEELKNITPYDPDHLPIEIGLIERFDQLYPNITQIACFDTAFHQTMPSVAQLIPLPRHYQAKGIKRYGFHGLSYSYLMNELERLDPVAAKGRVILAHLGSGASLAAVLNGQSLDTSMGFTATAGLVMSTRSGDLDPGLAYFLARTEQMSPENFQALVNHKSGLLGVSETSADVRDLLKIEGRDVRAAEALGLFCYQAKKWIGSFTAVLGGLETLIFSGGIGENSPIIRTRICDGLSFLGVEINESQNATSKPIISSAKSRVTIRVIRTDEELVIARSVSCILGNQAIV